MSQYVIFYELEHRNNSTEDMALLECLRTALGKDNVRKHKDNIIFIQSNLKNTKEVSDLIPDCFKPKDKAILFKVDGSYQEWEQKGDKAYWYGRPI